MRVRGSIAALGSGVLIGALLLATPLAAQGAEDGSPKAISGVPDVALRTALVAAKSGQELRLIVPAEDVRELVRAGFDIGAQVGTLPFFSASATREEILGVAQEGLPPGVSLNRLIPKPEPVGIPSYLEGLIINASQVTGASTLHDQGFRGQGRAIAVIDDGIQVTHPYFRGADGRSRVVAESCFVTQYFPVDLPCPGGRDSALGPGSADIGNNPDFSHGTHVAGIAAGNPAGVPGAEGYSGIAPEATLVVSRVFGFAGAFDVDIVAALDWVATNADTHNIASVNLSLGFFIARYYDCTSETDSVYGAVTAKLAAAGVTIVAASGNDGSYIAIGSPGCATGWVSVGATDELSRVASFSNVSEELDILAPGSNIWSSMPGNTFAAQGGTSMASPVVAGAFAVLRQALPGESGGAVLAAMRETGPRIDDILVKNLPTLRADMAYDRLVGSSRVAPTAPVSPTNVRVTPGNRSLRVVWDAPVSDGGSPLTDYVVTTSPVAHACRFPVTTTSCTISGLTNGERYTVTVVARNAFGASRPSDPSAAATPGARSPRPGPVMNLDARPLKRALRVTWSPPANVVDVGSLSYQYRVGKKAWIATTANSVVVRGRSGVTMRVSVRAVSDAGAGRAVRVTGVPR